MKPGVDLYARNVLVQKNAPEALPGWLRFVTGVVESESLGLALSRETTTDPNALARLRRVLVKTLLADLRALSKNDRGKFAEFWAEYSLFLKEGVCSDTEAAPMIAPLLRFDSSRAENGEMRSLDDYIGAMPSEQKNVYYLMSGGRDLALRSPYYEALQRAGREVLFMYSPVDEFVMTALGNYEKRKLISIESNDVAEEDMANERVEFELNDAQTEDLCEWLKDTLGERVKSVTPSRRLRQWPAIVTGHESSATQLMMQMAQGGQNMPTRPEALEVNPTHRVVRGLFYAMREEQETARLVAQQLLDNALIEAGLLQDPRGMLERTCDIMAAALDVEGIEAELRLKKKELKTRLTDNAKNSSS